MQYPPPLKNAMVAARGCNNNIATAWWSLCIEDNMYSHITHSYFEFREVTLFNVMRRAAGVFSPALKS